MSDLFERVRDLYGCATAWNANDEVPAHIQKLRAQNLKEFDRMIEQVKADVWDEGAETAWKATGDGHNGEYAHPFGTHDGTAPFQLANPDTPNPYRKQEEA